MKKVYIFIRIAVFLSAIVLFAYSVYFLVNLSDFAGEIAKYKDPNDFYYQMYLELIVETSILGVLGLLCAISLILSTIFFFYRFDGVPLWKKLAEKYEESKAARAEYRAKKTAEGRKKRAEQLQARMAAMQAEMDAMKDETDEPKE